MNFKTIHFDTYLYFLFLILFLLVEYPAKSGADLRAVRMTRELTQLRARAQSITNALTDVLSNDRDMAQMYLSYQSESGQPRPVTEHEEV